MIKFTATNALVYQVSPVMEIPSKTGGQPFYKREVIIDDTWTKDDHVYPNYVCIEFTGERMQLLDAIAPQSRVNVEGMITGREYNGKLFHSIRGLKIAPYTPPQQAPQFINASQQPPQGHIPQGYQVSPQLMAHQPVQPQAQAPYPGNPYPQPGGFSSQPQQYIGQSFPPDDLPS